MTAVALVERRRFPAMGSTAEVIAVGGGHGTAIDAAVARIGELEGRWSRFIESSEVSALNRGAGSAVPVSDDTLLLVELAAEAWRRTDGRFDPTVLAAVEATGYVGSFEQLGSTTSRSARAERNVGACEAIDIDRREETVRLPPGGGFDPGGIGKGLAADLVSHELAAAGVGGGCVNLGGDLRVWGVGPRGAGWRIGVGDHAVELTDVGVATSGTQRRTWVIDGETVHHVIDPATHRSSTSGAETVTVVAGSAWRAETCATALLATPLDEVASTAERWGVRSFVS
ncbi:MAG: FAD:protein FMN transferase [Actinomycetota bacterium]